jgi:hypothetical protein
LPTVFVIGRDWTFRASVRAELRERGIEALGMESEDEAGRAVAAGTVPSVIVWDTTDLPAHAEKESSPGANAVALLARRIPLVIVASRMAQEPLPAPATAVFHRPARVGDIVESVLELLRGQAA